MKNIKNNDFVIYKYNGKSYLSKIVKIPKHPNTWYTIKNLTNNVKIMTRPTNLIILKSYRKNAYTRLNNLAEYCSAVNKRENEIRNHHYN